MEISSKFSLRDIPDWWHQQEETDWKYTNLSNAARDIFSIIPHAVGVEASFSFARDIIHWRQSKTTGGTLRKKVVVRRYSCANAGILASADSELDTMNTKNDSEMNTEAEERKLHRMAKVQDCLEMRQGSQNLGATQKESHAQYPPMTAVWEMSDMEEIVKALWSLFQHDGAAAFKLSERSHLPQPLSAKDLPGGRTQILIVHRMPRIKRHPVEIDQDSTPETNSDADDWLHWNGALHDPNDSFDDCMAEVDSHIEQDNGIEDQESPKQRDVTATPNIPWLIRPTRQSKRQAEKVFMTYDLIEMRRNKGVNKK